MADLFEEFIRTCVWVYKVLGWGYNICILVSMFHTNHIQKKFFIQKKGKRKILKHGAYLPIVCPYAIK